MDNKILDDVNIIEFKQKYSLLSSEFYDDVLSEIGDLHDETLKV